jgi:hypothetical protein
MHPELAPYITLVRYERSKSINDYLSSVCDVRVIWGGDATISAIRDSSIPPRSSDVTFADRFSLAVIDSDEFIKNSAEEGFVSSFVSDFYNDTYLTDQNACTSPRLIVWLGDKKAEAKQIFWCNLHDFAQTKYAIQPIQSVDKLTNLYLSSAENYECGLNIESGEDNLVFRVSVDKADPALMKYRGCSGFFYEYDCKDITELSDFCNDIHCQTLALYGDESMIMPLVEMGIKGVDRISKIGHTLDFDLIWDGYNLVERFTRIINMPNLI